LKLAKRSTVSHVAALALLIVPDDLAQVVDLRLDSDRVKRR
jgi:hypothetical protein